MRKRMQASRDHLFSHAMFSGDEHVSVRRRNALDQRQHALHGRRFGHNGGLSLCAQKAILSFQALPFAQGPAEFYLAAQDGEQPGVIPGLLDEIPRPAPHGLNRQFDASQAVMTTTGSVLSRVWRRASRSNPS